MFRVSRLMTAVFDYIAPQGDLKPILLSVPHSGTAFPKELAPIYKQKMVDHPEDTDWFVDKLYDFATTMGIGMIRANLSRYVIDLNRDPDNQKLYDDKRQETSLVPRKSFAGEFLFNEPKFKLSDGDVEARKESFYWPYYREIDRKLDSLKRDFKDQPILFFDAHSIKRFVPSIRNKPFPDLILGNQDGKTCASQIIDSAQAKLTKGGFVVAKNEPFKGGHLTRNFGSPEINIHALQLEMSQDLYMDEAKCEISHEKFAKVQASLKEMFATILKAMESIA